MRTYPLVGPRTVTFVLKNGSLGASGIRREIIDQFQVHSIYVVIVPVNKIRIKYTVR